MSDFKMKTYKDSYLYNAKTVAGESADQNNKELLNFITKCHRIDKKSPAFNGVVEDIKRQQSSAYLISVLYNPYVVLCIGDNQLPRAFQVFDAKDSKSGGEARVFVDLTGRVEFKDGYYIAKRNELDKICALLIDAMIYLLYRHYPISLVNNGNIISNACGCYVSMFAYVIDYLRIIGYAENKKKIQYIIGMYFLLGLVGVENVSYARSLAAKVADITPAEGEAFEILIDRDFSCFANIGTFVDALVKGFRLRGLDLATFIGKWIKLFGTGTHYATELFTSFLVLTCNAYTGCYIVNQRQVEAACNVNTLAKLYNSIVKLGYDNLKGIRREDTEIKNVADIELSEALKLRENLQLNDISVKDFSSLESAVNEAQNVVNIYNKAKLEVGTVGAKTLANAIECAYNGAINLIEGKEPNYEIGTLTELAKIFKKTVPTNEASSLIGTLDRDINHLNEVIENTGAPASVKSELAKTIIEFRQIQKYI